jgi:hypothetical protein
MRKYHQYENDEYFIMGYKADGKQRRIINVIKGAGMGLLSGIAGTLVLNAVKKD